MSTPKRKVSFPGIMKRAAAPSPAASAGVSHDTVIDVFSNTTKSIRAIVVAKQQAIFETEHDAQVRNGRPFDSSLSS